MSKQLEFHEAANIFPLDEENIDSLAEDIKANGQQVAIETLDGKILDGRRRYLACQKVKVTPIINEAFPVDPVVYVMSLNAHRRHLSPTQLSLAGAKARDIYDRQAKERQNAGLKKGKDSVLVTIPEREKGTARDLAGKAVGVSGSLIDRASKVIAKGEPEVIKAVEEDRISVTTAAKLVEEPPEVQRHIATQSTKRNGRYRTDEVKRPDVEKPEGVERGKGVMLAHQAVDILKRIPKNDALRKRGFQIVTDWIRKNKE